MKDGGSAYPHVYQIQKEGDHLIVQGGMTLRQAYKIAAMQGLMDAYVKQEVDDFDAIGVAFVAATIADAMLAEDERHE